MEIEDYKIKFYPDLVEKGGLVPSINSVLKEVNSGLSTNEIKFDDKISFSYAVFKSENRSSQICIALKQRLFLGDLSKKGIHYGSWQTTSLIELANFLKDFLEVELDFFELEKKYKFVQLDEKARVYESGNSIEWEWENIWKWLPKDLPELIPILEEATNCPILRRMYPFTSVNRFCISPTNPYSFRYPIISPEKNHRQNPRNDYYFVISYDEKTKFGEGFAKEAIEIMIANFPKQ
jgi:hypothetical protein